MDSMSHISNLISCLTNDEDERQELWVYYLSGNDVSSIASYLDQINKEHSLDIELQSRLWFVLKNPPSTKFYNLLSQLSEIERSIVALLALGCSVAYISKYKKIAEIRIRQVISTIKSNGCLEELYGS